MGKKIYRLLWSILLVHYQVWAVSPEETIYLTWQQDPATTMTIQWVSFTQDKQSTVAYSSLDGARQWKQVSGEVFPFPDAPQYAIHRVELTRLQPSTQYVFKVLPRETEYRFLTAPAELDKEIRFVVGGDMYHDSLALLNATNKKAAETTPLFAVLGGDIAYSVRSGLFGFQEIGRWIDWLKSWHTYMVTPDGNLVPVVAAIGNHDLNGGFGQTPSQAGIFAALFPMPGKRVYDVLDFNSYLSLFLLDSGHANPVKGEQTAWLKEALDKRQKVLYKLAVYHVPAYPSVRDHKIEESAVIRASWVPLFEKGGIQAVFEHHDHAYKRTHPLLNGKIHPDGIVYIGDGAWGVEKPRVSRYRYPYIANLASVRHFITVTLSRSQLIVRAVDVQGHVLDVYQKLRDTSDPKDIKSLQETKSEALQQS